jgi:predicted transcriptional regulator
VAVREVLERTPIRELKGAISILEQRSDASGRRPSLDILLNMRDGAEGRPKVWDHVRQNPGSTKSGLRKATRLSWAAIAHHINSLERLGLLQQVRHHGRVHLFTTEFSTEACRHAIAHEQSVTHDILRHLEQWGSLRTSHLAQMLGHSRKLIRSHLDTLIWAGLVDMRGSQRPEYHIKAPPLHNNAEPMGNAHPELN